MAVLLWLIIVIQAVTVIIFIKVSWWLTIVPEMFVVLLIAYGIFALFRRCPVCGKRKVTIISAYGGTRYATSNGVCRGCKSHVSIMYDREESKSTYYVDDKYGQPHFIEPIWETSKDKKK